MAKTEKPAAAASEPEKSSPETELMKEVVRLERLLLTARNDALKEAIAALEAGAYATAALVVKSLLPKP